MSENWVEHQIMLCRQAIEWHRIRGMECEWLELELEHYLQILNGE
jgi:hypothetical protein